jgi:mono/diheme cytochrome c family protein
VLLGQEDALVLLRFRRPGYARFILLAWVVLVAATSSARAADGRISFNDEVRPILSDKCYACHGPDEVPRQAGLRLDIKEGVLNDPSGFSVVVPGKPDESELVAHITSDDPDYRMPPPHANRQLTPEQIETLVEWVRQGAEWEDHWSYTPLVRDDARGEPPAVNDEAWPTGAIDHFILSGLEADGLTPSPEAERATLIRRVTFDLTGLPPTPDEVAAFLADDSPEAYETVVDRLLSSPRYGERIATHWLDLVRYADTSGYHSDELVSVWPYRDYVIAAFNDNMPYDRFTRENLAGDLLPNATRDQKVASAFNRLNQTTAEGGAQAKEYHAMYAADRVRATSTVWMGATMQCAQCHDHKFDPFTTKDFYSLAAFFADVDEVGVYRGGSKWEPVVMLPTEEQQDRLDDIDHELSRLRSMYESPRPGIVADRRAWETDLSRRLESDEPAEYVWVDAEVAGDPAKDDDEPETPTPEPLLGESSVHVTTEEEAIVQHIPRGMARPMVVGEGDMLFAHVWIDPENPPSAVMVQWNDGSWEHRAFWGEDTIEYGDIGEDGPAHKPMGPLPTAGEWVRLEVAPADVGLEPDKAVRQMSFTQFGGSAYWDKAGVDTTEAGIVRNENPADVVTAIGAPEIIRTGDTQGAIAGHYRTITPKLSLIRDELAVWNAKRAEAEKEVAYCVTTVSKPPRPVRVLPRGNWMDDSGEMVYPNTPEFLPELKHDPLRRPTRLDLANWLVSRENPMTARAFVNRFWAMFFGSGVARVMDDLGSQGERPDHPELLDWLAIEFMDTGWNVKHIARLMVTSSAYRQSSQPSPELLERDPYNRLIARQSRRRLDAEMIRDNALSVAGVLVGTIGGPSVRPYQPEGYYAHLNFPKRVYKHDAGDGQHRRGLYTHRQRTFPHPSLIAFDAPTRQECTAERSKSNTPTQALALLNDPTYVEAAQAFAARILREGGGDEERSPTDRITWAYELALSRAPDAEELAVVTALYEKHLNEYTDDPEAAAVATGGEDGLADDIEPAELAAWTSVARVMLNLNEGVTRY